jgi:RNA polymerase sigma-70 factor (ECF subfamily)
MDAPAMNRPMVTDDALRVLFESHGAAVLAHATRLTGDRQAAEDVLQETMFRAWQHPESLEEGVFSTRSWLFRVARNLVFDRARSRSRRPAETSGVLVDLIAVSDDSDRVVDSLVAMEALGRLSAAHRDVLVQLYLKERTVAETALLLGIPEGTVRSRSFYALRTLRLALGSSDSPGTSVSLDELTHARRVPTAA